MDESQGPSTSREERAHSIGASKEMGTQSFPESTPATEEESAEEELEDTSLMELEETSLRELEGTSLRELEETSVMDKEGVTLNLMFILIY